MPNAYTQADFDEMITFSLQRKVQITTTRLLEWYNLYDGLIYFVFDGTPESRVLVDVAARFYANMAKPDEAPRLIHVQTGAELPALDGYVSGEIEKLSAVSIEYIEPEQSYDATVAKYGLPAVSQEVSQAIEAARRGATWAVNELTTGKFKRYKALLDSGIKISPYCCEVMKERPYREYERETGRAAVYPTLADSEGNKRVWLSQGCNSAETNESRPMSFWTRRDIIEYAKAAKLALPDFPTGCARCMFNKTAGYYRELKKDAHLWERCVVHPGIDKVLDIIGIDSVGK